MNPQSRIKQIGEKWDALDKWTKRVLGSVATLGTIIGLVAGGLSWGVSVIDNHLDKKLQTITEQISILEAKSDAADKKLELSNTRLELSNLIGHNPSNVAQIEMVARHYFVDLGGDWYMSGIYSQWAREYGGDISFVVHKE